MLEKWQKLDATQWQYILKTYRAIAVIRTPEIELGLEMARAVIEGGMRLIEITWNSQRPEKLISQLRQDFPECIIGTGTILTPEHLQQAIAAGAQFAFTPHVNVHLIQAAQEANIPMVAGALSPTEIVTAWQAGASCVKVFPAPSLGGVSYIKSLQGPLGHIPLIPTGGVTLENALDYIEAGAIAVGLSSSLLPASLINARDWKGISQLANQLNCRLLGINN